MRHLILGLVSFAAAGHIIPADFLIALAGATKGKNRYRSSDQFNPVVRM